MGYQSSYADRIHQTPSLKSDRWAGERGESVCAPQSDAARQIMEERGISGVQYHDGVPDFSPFSESTVKLGYMTDARHSQGLTAGRDGKNTIYAHFEDGETVSESHHVDKSSMADLHMKYDKPGNFEQADALTAEQWTADGRDGKEWTAEDVAQYRQDHGLTWHECNDMETMQMIPEAINADFGHLGGVGEVKETQRIVDEALRDYTEDQMSEAEDYNRMTPEELEAATREHGHYTDDGVWIPDQPDNGDNSEAAGKQELLNEDKLREVKVPIEPKDESDHLDNPPLAAEEGDNMNERLSDDVPPLDEKVDSNGAGFPNETREEKTESSVFDESADPVNNLEKREPAEFVPLPREISREAVLDGADRVGMMQSDKIQLNQWGPDQQEGFWEYKARSKEEYLEMASHIPEVYERLQNGESLEDLVQDEKVGACAEQYFLPENMVTVDHHADGSYQFTDYGRHRIAAAQELGIDIPVKINEIGDPEQYEITQQEKQDRYNDLMDYMEEHNYSEIDRGTYEKDPEWQRLHDAYDHPVKDGDKPEPADWEKDADAMLKQRYEQMHEEHDDILDEKQNESKEEEQKFTDPKALGEGEEGSKEGLEKKTNEDKEKKQDFSNVEALGGNEEGSKEVLEKKTNEDKEKKQDFSNVEALGGNEEGSKEGSERKTNEDKEKKRDFSTLEALGKSDDDSEKDNPKDDNDINDMPKEPIDDSHTNIR